MAVALEGRTIAGFTIDERQEAVLKGAALCFVVAALGAFAHLFAGLTGIGFIGAPIAFLLTVLGGLVGGGYAGYRMGGGDFVRGLKYGAVAALLGGIAAAVVGTLITVVGGVGVNAIVGNRGLLPSGFAIAGAFVGVVSGIGIDLVLGAVAGGIGGVVGKDDDGPGTERQPETTTE